jgi:tRNA pseudouridine55 synthase
MINSLALHQSPAAGERRSSWEGVFVVDKPSGCTSNRVLQELKRISGLRKMGYLGTLDPLATGVLPVFTGWTTKIIPFIPDSPKGYRGTMVLGKKTDTQDETGKVIFETDRDLPKRETVERISREFIGLREQVPPAYSALKHKGKPLYRWARQGMPIVKPARRITVEEWKIRDLEGSEVSFEVFCSPGTYIRTLCSDLGDRLGCGAYLKRLRRIQNGFFTLTQAHPLQAFQQVSNPEDLARLRIPLEEILKDLPEILVDASWKEKIKLGCPLRAGSGQIAAGPVKAGEPVRIHSLQKELWAIYEWTGTGEQLFRPLRVLI